MFWFGATLYAIGFCAGAYFGWHLFAGKRRHDLRLSGEMKSLFAHLDETHEFVQKVGGKALKPQNESTWNFGGNRYRIMMERLES